MSWFSYNYSAAKEKRSHRKGVWLRAGSLSQDVLDAIGKSKLVRKEERIDFVIVKELRPNQMVILEIWCRDYFDLKERWNVFHLLMKENPEWVCEGDLGRGYVYARSKTSTH